MMNQEYGMQKTGETAVAAERDIRTVTLEIKTLHTQAKQIIVTYMIEIGRRLVEAKSMLEHGKWGDWLKNEVEFSQRSANEYMRIFEEYGASQIGLFGGEANSQTFANLSYSKALKLIAIPADEREEFAKTNNVEELSTRELDKLIRERDEARKEAETLREDLKVQMDEQQRTYDVDLADANEKAEAAAEKVEALRRELQELKSRPVDVQVAKAEPDEKTMESIRREAAETARRKTEAELSAKIERAEQARQKAEEDKRKAEERLNAQVVAREQENDAVEKEKELLRERAAELEKRLALASSSEKIVFKLHFEAAQNAVNKMLEIIGKMEGAGASEDAEKLKTAVRAVLTQTLGALK